MKVYKNDVSHADKQFFFAFPEKPDAGKSENQKVFLQLFLDQKNFRQYGKKCLKNKYAENTDPVCGNLFAKNLSLTNTELI